MVLMLDALDNITFHSSKLKEQIIDFRLSCFSSKVIFNIKCGDYTIRTARSRADLLKVIELRNHSFVAEFSDTLYSEYIEFDDHDMLADHIMVLNTETDQLLGSYRIISSHNTENFYSPSQFSMNSILSKSDAKMELSRACVHKDFRNGIILNLIWKGIASYIKATNTRYIFGCTSIKTIDPKVAFSIYTHLKQNKYSESFHSDVLPKYQYPQHQDTFDLLSKEEINEYIPVLLKSYLKAGAYICSQPALDTVYGCTDILTILDMENIEPKYQQRYFNDNNTYASIS
jgi:putative hemolysin